MITFLLLFVFCSASKFNTPFIPSHNELKDYNLSQCFTLEYTETSLLLGNTCLNNTLAFLAISKVRGKNYRYKLISAYTHGLFKTVKG